MATGPARPDAVEELGPHGGGGERATHTAAAPSRRASDGDTRADRAAERTERRAVARGSRAWALGIAGSLTLAGSAAAVERSSRGSSGGSSGTKQASGSRSRPASQSVDRRAQAGAGSAAATQLSGGSTAPSRPDAPGKVSDFGDRDASFAGSGGSGTSGW
ncbi:MAG: hypothetical protein ACRCY8_07050, partial [Dermatophilaceae bacterium]